MDGLLFAVLNVPDTFWFEACGRVNRSIALSTAFAEKPAA
jgi:hypothetical protein